jgi:hypothetical protein
MVAFSVEAVTSALFPPAFTTGMANSEAARPKTVSERIGFFKYYWFLHGLLERRSYEFIIPS